MFMLVDSRHVRHQLAGNGPWLVGRDPGAHIGFPDDPHCSRRQFELHREGAGLLLVPLSSRSPCLVDGRPAAGPTRVVPGNVLGFGRSTLRIEGFRETTVLDDHRIGGGWEIIIGRDPGPRGLRIEQQTVSRRHAAFVPRLGGGEIRDLRSTNGTYVNGQRIAGTMRLREGDEVCIGQTRLVCRDAHLMPMRGTALRTVKPPRPGWIIAAP